MLARTSAFTWAINISKRFILAGVVHIVSMAHNKATPMEATKVVQTKRRYAEPTGLHNCHFSIGIHAAIG